MKTLCSIMMSLLILTSNLGWIQTTHYCLGRPVEAAFGLEVEHLSCDMAMITGCSKEMEQKPGCCHNESEKLSLDQHILAQGLDFTPNVVLITVPSVQWPVIIDDTKDEILIPEGFTHEEPPPKNTPLFIAYQTWLI